MRIMDNSPTVGVSARIGGLKAQLTSVSSGLACTMRTVEENATLRLRSKVE